MTTGHNGGGQTSVEMHHIVLLKLVNAIPVMWVNPTVALGWEQTVCLAALCNEP